MDGCFSSPSYNSIGDPYTDCKEMKRGAIKGTRQFGTARCQSGQTGANWGNGTRKFQGLSGQYQEQYKEECQYRMQNTKKNLLPQGFKYSNPASKSCGLGDDNGTISKGYEYMSDGKYKKGGPTKKYTKEIKRNIITTPCKKGTYGYGGTLMGGKQIPYFRTNNDGPKTRTKIVADEDEKPAFKPVGTKSDVLNGSYGWDEKCLEQPVDPEDSMTPKERVEAKVTDAAAWKPSHSGETGKMATFDKFPTQLPDVYDERIVNHAMTPSRRNPVKAEMKDLPESIRERKAFQPSSGPKSKLTKGTAMMGITKHHV